MKEKLSIALGTDNFRKLITTSDVFVDKTLFIKEIIDRGEEAILITRPRRWGKSLALDMLKTFLATEVDENGNKVSANPNRVLFEGGSTTVKSSLGASKQVKLAKSKLAHEEGGKYLAAQGNFPIIHISFKDVKADTYAKVKKQIGEVISNIFGQYNYLHAALSRSKSAIDKEKTNKFLRILQKKCSQPELEGSLKFLTELLYKHHQQKVYVLVDEYDKPVNHFLSKDLTSGSERDLVAQLITSMMGACGKGNDCLQKIVITGILDAFKKDAGSGFNNVKVFDLQSTGFSASFGFSEKEVKALIKKLTLKTQDSVIASTNIQAWYNGYNIAVSTGEIIQVYTPWSVMNYLSDISQDKSGTLPQPKSYWTSSGISEILDNLSTLALSRGLLDKLKELGTYSTEYKGTGLAFREDFYLFRELQTKEIGEEVMAYLLLSNGYLSKKDGNIVIPNQEVLGYFKRQVLQAWVSKEIKENNLGDEGKLLKALSASLINEEEFKKKVQALILNKIQGGAKTESYFQSLIGGLIEWHALNDGEGATHHVLSEKSVGSGIGSGRIDNIFYPIEPSVDGSCARGISAVCVVKAGAVPADRAGDSKSENYAIIHEYKKLDNTKRGELESTLCEAMWQMLAKGYLAEPLVKKEVHAHLHMWNKIKLRSVVFIRDETKGKWSLHIKEKELTVAEAKIVEQFFSYKLVQEKLKGATESERSAKREALLKKLLDPAKAEKDVFSLIDAIITKGDDLLKKLRENALLECGLKKADVDKILSKVLSTKATNAQTISGEIKRKFKSYVSADTIELLLGSFKKVLQLTDRVTADSAASIAVANAGAATRHDSVASPIDTGLVRKKAAKVATPDSQRASAETEITVHKTRGDGNCLFHAVKHQLGLIGHKNAALSHVDLRQRAVDTINTDAAKKKIIQTLREAKQLGENYTQYTRKMRTDGVWGGGPEIAGLATYLCVNIAVLYKDELGNTALKELVYPIGSDAKANKDVLFIMHSGEKHYDSVISIPSGHSLIKEVAKIKPKYAFSTTVHASAVVAAPASAASPYESRFMAVDEVYGSAGFPGADVEGAPAAVVPRLASRFKSKGSTLPIIHAAKIVLTGHAASTGNKRRIAETAEDSIAKKPRLAQVTTTGTGSTSNMVVDVAAIVHRTAAVVPAETEISKFRMPSLRLSEAPRGTLYLKQTGSVWGEYYEEGFSTLLSLRLSQTDSISANVMIIDEVHPVPIGLSYHGRSSIVVVPMIYQAADKPAHWVGAILDAEKKEGLLTNTWKITYIDPENNPIPQSIVQALTQALTFGASITFEQKFVREQSYNNNCGPELIEHFAEAITGHRVPEDNVAAYHSELLAGFLWIEAVYMVKELPLLTEDGVIQGFMESKALALRSQLDKALHISIVHDVTAHIYRIIPPVGDKSVTDRALVVYRDKRDGSIVVTKLIEQAKTESANPTLRLDPIDVLFHSFIKLINQASAAVGELIFKAQELLNEVLDGPESTKQTIITTLLLHIVDALHTAAPMPFFPGWGGGPDDDPGYGGSGGDKKLVDDDNGFGAMFGASPDNTSFDATNTSIAGDFDDMNDNVW